MLLATAVTLLVLPLDQSLAILLLIVVVAIDAHHVFSLKNFFLIYAVLLFGVGEGVMHLAEASVMGDAIGYVVAFLCGYSFLAVRRWNVDAVGIRPSPKSARMPQTGRLRVSTIERAMTTITVVSLLLLALQYRRYGIVGYYQGQQLVDQFLTYGAASTSGGAEQIVRFALRYSAIAFVILYCQYCFRAAIPVQYRYPVGLLVVLPIVFLQRFDAVIGAATAIAIYACERRITSTGRSPLDTGPPTEQPEAKARRSRMQSKVVAATVVATVVAAFLAAFLIGGLRNNAALGDSPAPSVSTTGLLTQEFTPIQAYSDIKVYSEMLGHPRGTTIVFPLLLKVVPRAWFPSKPLNSGGYYMSVVHPATYAAGFALPPTYFGDALLSFGFLGALAMCLLLGCVSARVDVGYKDVILSRIPLFLIFFANYYGIMRFPLSESLAGILLTLAVYKVSSRFFTLGARSGTERVRVSVAGG